MSELQQHLIELEEAMQEFIDLGSHIKSASNVNDQTAQALGAAQKRYEASLEKTLKLLKTESSSISAAQKKVEKSAAEHIEAMKSFDAPSLLAAQQKTICDNVDKICQLTTEAIDTAAEQRARDFAENKEFLSDRLEAYETSFLSKVQQGDSGIKKAVADASKRLSDSVVKSKSSIESQISENGDELLAQMGDLESSVTAYAERLDELAKDSSQANESLAAELKALSAQSDELNSTLKAEISQTKEFLASQIMQAKVFAIAAAVLAAVSAVASFVL